MNKRERGNYTGKYEVLGDVELVGEEAVEAERQIAQADSESKLRQTHFASGFDAGRASAQAELERLQQENAATRAVVEELKANNAELERERHLWELRARNVAQRLETLQGQVENALVTYAEGEQSEGYGRQNA